MDGQRWDTKETTSMETILWEVTKDKEDRHHPDGPPNLGFGWSAEEAEVAAQERTVWSILTNQAASADNA